MKPFVISKPKAKTKKRWTFEGFLGIPYQALIIVLIMIPIFLMLLYSFQSRETSQTFTLIFTLDNYLRFINEPIFVGLMAESIGLAFVATLVSLLIGYPLAYIISKSNTKTKTLLILLITAPMWINMLLRTKALEQVILMIAPDLIGTNLAIIIGMTYVYLPFMVLPIYTVLSKIDIILYESASDLGANKLQTLIKVVIPLSISGVLSGIMMVFLPSATTLVVPKYLGAGRFLIGNLIENAIISQGDFGYGSSIALLMAGIILVFLYAIKKVDKYTEGGDE
ncbi:MAG TPA: ABC transporter permease [Acholeplasmataceae bacterium]|nr:ABC transporter permease [Acholeplasmataceae bacterium]